MQEKKEKTHVFLALQLDNQINLSFIALQIFSVFFWHNNVNDLINWSFSHLIIIFAQ